MGEALVGGLVEAEWAPLATSSLSSPWPSEETSWRRRTRAWSQAEIGDLTQSATCVLAVKPNHCEEACAALAPLAPTRVLSIAAGVTTRSLESWLPPKTRVVRAMPNTPALVGCRHGRDQRWVTCDAEDLSWASGILASVGEVVTLAEEALDAVTGLSGSGPAYVFRLAEALIDAGESVGLDRLTADVLTRQTLLGAARLLAESGADPAQLRANVTSPGGTTAAGLAVLEEADFGAIVKQVVEAATDRSRELGQA